MYAQYRTVVLSSLATVFGAVLLLSWVGFAVADKAAVLENFEECVAAGNPVMESYPRRCRSANMTFTEDIGNAIEMADQIRVSIPRPNQGVYSPIAIEGEARSDWFASGTFPIFLVDASNRTIASTTALAKEDDTFGFVRFDAHIAVPSEKVQRAVLVFKKSKGEGAATENVMLTLPIRVLGTGATQEPIKTTRVFPREISLRPGDVVEFSDGLFVRFAGISESFCNLADVRCRWVEGRFADLEMTGGALGKAITDVRLELTHHPAAALSGYDFELRGFEGDEIFLGVPSNLNAVISRSALAASE